MTDMPSNVGPTQADQIVTVAGRGLVRTNLIGTVLFVVSAAVAATVFNGPARVVGAAVALLLFATGVVAFLAGYWDAVQRSRTDEIAVSQLYFFGSGIAPKQIKSPMMILLATQTVVGLATALARPSTDGKPGSTLAFGVLVPMFGLGLNGLWSARHGQFKPRALAIDCGAKSAKVNAQPRDVPPSPQERTDNADHG